MDGPTMDTRPRVANPRAAHHDKNFVRDYYYDHDIRWIVDRNIPFSYEEMMKGGLKEISK